MPAPVSAPPPPAAPRPPRGGLLLALRVVVSLLFLMLALQVAFIAGYLGGSNAMLNLHAANAFFLTVVAFVAFVVAILFATAGRGAVWPAPAAGVLWLLLFVEEILGSVDLIALHIPLGVSIVAFGLVLLVAVWRLRYRPRPRTAPTRGIRHAPPGRREIA